jgi:trehalose-phosphatase
MLIQWPGHGGKAAYLHRKIVPISQAPKQSIPRPALAHWDEISRELERHGPLAVLSDFDGTLAPIRRRPESVRMNERVRNVLADLAKRGDLVGIVSGRSLADIRKRVGLGGICYVGCHGYSMEDSRGRVVTIVTPSEKALLARVKRFLAPKLRPLHGVRIESKEAGIAIHYRDATRAASKKAKWVVDAALRQDRRLHLLRGKKVWEFLPGPGIDKWTAIRFLLALENRAESLLVYIGDDLTDEHVFARLRGVSIVVGKRRRTAARFFVRNPADVRRVLEKLLEKRK